MEFFSEITALAALAVVVVQQILKLNAVPLYFANRHPVPTNIALSIIAAVVVTWQTAVALSTWVEWVVYVGTISVLAAVTYNMTLSNSEEIQKLSDKTSKDV